MTEKRDKIGYGSSYEKGKGSIDSIGAVFGGQTWAVKPDKKAQAKTPCIWMQAGVVEFKGCNNFYDCTNCKYDQGMLKNVAKGKTLSWQNALRRRPALDRICRHSLTNRIAKRACAYDYECGSCDFDQYFEEVYTAKSKTSADDVQNIKGFELPMGFYFHNGHTWARIESGGAIRVGMDDFAMKVLGQADAFDLPLMGKVLDAGKAGWGLKRKDNTADVLSPVNGIIMEVNTSVNENPEITNSEPYEGGWLFTLHTNDIKGTMKMLMDEKNSIAWLTDEVDTLEKMVEETAGPAATDGGYLSQDVFGNLPELGWNNLTKTFLKS